MLSLRRSRVEIAAQFGGRIAQRAEQPFHPGAVVIPARPFEIAAATREKFAGPALVRRGQHVRYPFAEIGIGRDRGLDARQSSGQ